MSQVIEVRFVNPVNQEVLTDRFVTASSHKSAIETILDIWTEGEGVLKSVERQGDAKYVKAGINSSWQYIYLCLLDDEGVDREMYAILFAQYKEDEPQE